MDAEIVNRKYADGELQKELYAVVPLGTILPWVNKPDKDSPHVEDLPLGFALCDGSAITEGIWQGRPTPDLTNTAKFLRGGTMTQVLEMEDAMLQDHNHIDPGHNHQDNGHSHSYVDFELVDNMGDDWCDGGYWARHFPEKTTAAEIADITHEYTGMVGVDTTSNVKAGEETRPSNMRVMFIMKVVS